MKILFFVGLFLFPFLLCAQEANDEIDDFSKVKSAILAWADTTFYDYNEPRFENYRANYSDEYLIATMRVKSIERSIKNLKKRIAQVTIRSLMKPIKSRWKSWKQGKTKR